MLTVDQERLEHIERLETFQGKLRSTQADARKYLAKRSPVGKLVLASRGVLDFGCLLFMVLRGRRFLRVIFLTRRLVLYERFLESLPMEGVLLINYHQTVPRSIFRGRRVYNLGILVGSIKRLLRTRPSLRVDSGFFAWFYDRIRPLLKEAEVFVPCYYDANGLALIWRPWRNDYDLIEIQHGGICNFEPYSRPVSFRLVDTVMVSDERTAVFLKGHLYQSVPVNIEIIESGESVGIPQVDNEIPVILYCSTIEINGIHEKFLSFLRSSEQPDRFHLRVRLHPRERDRKERFAGQLREAGFDFEFDESANWLVGNPFMRVIVVIPWSSIVEEAVRGGVRSVILDEFGRERFHDLIDESICWYEDDGIPGLEQALKSVKELEMKAEQGG